MSCHPNLAAAQKHTHRKWNAHTGPSLASNSTHMPCSGSRVHFIFNKFNKVSTADPEPGDAGKTAAREGSVKT